MATPIAQSLRTRREAVVKAHIEAEAVHRDAAAAVAAFHHPRYEVPAMGAIVDGADAVHALLAQLLTAFPDLWLHKLSLHNADDAVNMEMRLGGTHRGVW